MSFQEWKKEVKKLLPGLKEADFNHSDETVSINNYLYCDPPDDPIWEEEDWKSSSFDDCMEEKNKIMEESVKILKKSCKKMGLKCKIDWWANQPEIDGLLWIEAVINVRRPDPKSLRNLALDFPSH